MARVRARIRAHPPAAPAWGVMVFSGAGAALKGKIITQITLRITCSAAGSGSSSKKLSFRRSNYQTLQTGIRGSAQVGAALGTLTGKFYNNTVTHTLSATSNATLFEAMKTYFAEGNSVLVLYNGETSSSSGYSSNYARVTSCTITVTYIHATVWYRNGSTWQQCTGVVPQRRFMGAGGSVLLQRRDVGSRLTATNDKLPLPDTGGGSLIPTQGGFFHEGLFH